MNAEMECSICYCTYARGSRTPRVLPCQHAFCNACLLALLSLAEPDASGLRQLFCPLCRRPTQVRKDGKDLLLPVDPRLWEQVLAAGSQEAEEEEERTNNAAALKRRAKRWAKILKKSLGLQRQSPSNANAVCVDMRDMVLMASFQII
ncbi:E3 ubiquitin-protein ligase RNF186-like [Heptranchias perlo]|uniref:E3 ubiquitin-protein ligase RNF186-like n=1 Tax=Heptranchias perlo TaxID=212740 RepID=UPI00355A9B70